MQSAYTIEVHRLRSDAFLESSLASQSVLDIGRILVRGATGVDNWSSIVKQPSDVAYDDFLFEIAQEELPPLYSLEEFQSTDIEYVFRSCRQFGIEEPRQRLAPRKTRKIEIPEPSLFRMIPQPHYRSQLPHGPQQLQVLEAHKLLAYSQRSPVPLDPETDMSKFFGSNALTRCAWVIPVRGRLYFPDATPARMCDIENVMQLGVRNVASEESGGLETCILWSPKALRAFWDWLLQYHANGAFGPIALSFKAVVPGIHYEDVYEDDEDGGSEIGECLDYIDHIKVYHDAYLSLHLRNAISLWKYQSTPSSRRRHFMRGAKLLLEGSGKAVCIV
ncbi:hypothetical protein OE88DRAFT_1806925 [Heliocybe sulcata]|uniref:Uncharacterized protein n=1 Tax=Heliocybe sulcata TaxID=5364 RepID=A0A5C3N990_9AGAM|nr:hypothetical protein OE88DRAFT_1806925 [Heliocybe sulcata]